MELADYMNGMMHGFGADGVDATAVLNGGHLSQTTSRAAGVASLSRASFLFLRAFRLLLSTYSASSGGERRKIKVG